MTHTITILGSTGSIGRQTLSVAEELGLLSLIHISEPTRP